MNFHLPSPKDVTEWVECGKMIIGFIAGEAMFFAKRENMRIFNFFNPSIPLGSLTKSEGAYAFLFCYN